MHRPALLAACLAWSCAVGASAQDIALSGFGTLGYARSNSELTYQRWIDDNGSFERDSVLGAQADVRFTPQWSATLQVKLSPSLKSDERWDLVPAWAFVAWRPANDWLVRAGRMRVPLYLHSESMDVGNTYDLARLPAEMYGLVPSTDFGGLSVAKTWNLGERDLSLDVYSGEIGSTARFWLRDGIPGQLAAGSNFRGVKVATTGVVFTHRSPQTTWRVGVHRARTRLSNGQPIATDYPYVQIAPGVGYYQVSEALPGPGVQTVPSVHNSVYTLGFDHEVVNGWYVAGEFARNVQHDTRVGLDTRGGYLAVFHNIGHWIPYLSWAYMKASDETLSTAERLLASRVPSFIPGAEQINASQRTAGEFSYAVDQRTWALGSSYGIDPNQKLKFEWSRTLVGRISRFVDTPPGQETPSRIRINVWSASYNFNF